MKKLVLASMLGVLSLSLSSQTEDKDATITSLQNEVKELSRKNEELRMELSRLQAKYSVASTGEEYRVQLGIQNPDKLINSLLIPKKIIGSNINGKLVYDIGGFTNPDEAYNLSQEMRRLNLSGAFVTRYVNGLRDYNFKYGENRMSYSNNYKQPTPTKLNLNYDDNMMIGNMNSNSTPAKKSEIMIIEE